MCFLCPCMYFISVTPVPKFFAERSWKTHKKENFLPCIYLKTIISWNHKSTSWFSWTTVLRTSFSVCFWLGGGHKAAEKTEPPCLCLGPPTVAPSPRPGVRLAATAWTPACPCPPLLYIPFPFQLPALWASRPGTSLTELLIQLPQLLKIKSLWQIPFRMFMYLLVVLWLNANTHFTTFKMECYHIYPFLKHSMGIRFRKRS